MTKLIKRKTKKYHAVGTVPNLDIKIVLILNLCGQTILYTSI